MVLSLLHGGCGRAVWCFYCTKSTKYIHICVCVRVYIYIYIYISNSIPNAIWQMSGLANCTFAWPSYLRDSLSLSLSFSLCLPIFPSQCLVAVVYVILLFHIVPFKKPQRRSSWWNRGTPEIYGRSRVNMRRAQRVDFLTFQFYWKRNEWFLLSRETRLFRWILAEGWRIVRILPIFSCQ